MPVEPLPPFDYPENSEVSCLTHLLYTDPTHSQIISTSVLLALELQNEGSYSIGLEDDNNIFLWNVCFEGSEDTVYEVSTLLCKLIDLLGRLLQSTAEVPKGLP